MTCDKSVWLYIYLANIWKIMLDMTGNLNVKVNCWSTSSDLLCYARRFCSCIVVKLHAVRVAAGFIMFFWPLTYSLLGLLPVFFFHLFFRHFYQLFTNYLQAKNVPYVALRLHWFNRFFEVWISGQKQQCTSMLRSIREVIIIFVSPADLQQQQ